MVTVLKFLAAVFLVIAVVLVGGALFLRHKIKMFFHQALKDTGFNSGTPQTLHLNQIEDREWLKQPPACDILHLFEEHGYRAGAVYEVAEMPTALVLAMEHPNQGTLASIMRHDRLGTWIELNAETEDLVFVFSDAPQAFSHHPAWLEARYFTETSPAQVLASFEQRLAGERIRPVPLQSYRTWYENNYRRLMQWRNEAGGITPDEVRRQNAQNEHPLDEEDLAEGYLQVKISEFNAWHLALLEELETNPELSPTDEPLFLVPDQALCEAFIEYLDNHLEFSERLQQELRGQAHERFDCGAFFDEILNRLSEPLRPREYCRVTFPLRARVFTENPVQVNTLEEPDD
jgi:hypothetical protein